MANHEITMPLTNDSPSSSKPLNIAVEPSQAKREGPTQSPMRTKPKKRYGHKNIEVEMSRKVMTVAQNVTRKGVTAMYNRGFIPKMSKTNTAF